MSETPTPQPEDDKPLLEDLETDEETSVKGGARANPGRRGGRVSPLRP